MTQIVSNAKDFFSEVVEQAIAQRRLKTEPLVKEYLVGLLSNYILTANLFSDDESGKKRQDTLAETLLKAYQVETPLRREMLKKLGDTSLYISGFFGDSLRRKLVDVDYYAEIGGVAYGSLAGMTSEERYAWVYTDFSQRFLEYVDLLTYISQQASIQSDKDVLRLYDRYMTTGSSLAKEQLVELGLLNLDLKKAVNQ